MSQEIIYINKLLYKYVIHYSHICLPYQLVEGNQWAALVKHKPPGCRTHCCYADIHYSVERTFKRLRFNRENVIKTNTFIHL